MALTLRAGVAALLGVPVGEPRQLTGGASRETWAFPGERPAVLRRDPPGHGDAARMRAEVACLRAAAAAGVPVPAVLAAGDTAPGIEAPFILTEHVAGEALPRKLLRDPGFDAVRPQLACELGRVLGAIHGTPVETLGMLDDTDPLDAIEAVYRDLRDPRPAVEAALHWLREHRPADRPRALVHGDFRLGNLLVDGTGVRAVLDWELAHLGNPIEDLGWLCVRAWRFGAQPPVAGVGTREQLLDGYAAVTGFRPDPAELHWWEAYGTLRWLVLSRFQAERHFSGAEPALELAAIGRRVCESEYDLLAVLGLLVDVPAPDPVPYAAPLHGRPTLPELLDLVAGTLADDLTVATDRERYLLRICVSLLRTAGRELAAGDGVAVPEAELAERLRTGAARYRDDAVRHAMSAAVLARVRVVNPRHAGE
ncbi:phosphotransferase [Nocardia sp. NPDC057353]|uniref:phosphotransferase n=1 Tax=Nocardia sp. NPDC057353 TaxID=3346104 RepID=UPI0036405CEC